MLVPVAAPLTATAGAVLAWASETDPFDAMGKAIVAAFSAADPALAPHPMTQMRPALPALPCRRPCAYPRPKPTRAFTCPWPWVTCHFNITLGMPLYFALVQHTEWPVQSGVAQASDPKLPVGPSAVRGISTPCVAPAP